MRRNLIISAIFTLLAVGVSVPAMARGPLQVAIFAGGCFWTMEHGLEDIPGVVSAVSGYTGGREPHPTYDEVSSERTGHVEAVRVTFDWRLIDPTDGNGQACDQRPSYHAAIFVSSPEQRRIAEASRAAINTGRLRGRIVTPIRDATPFWPAEEVHQHFTQKEPMRYQAYRMGCGRDGILRQIWGGR